MQRILLFHIDKEGYNHTPILYRRKSKDTIFWPKIMEINEEDFVLIVYIYPAYESLRITLQGRKNIPWKPGGLIWQMQSQCMRLAADTYYLTPALEEKLKGHLAGGNKQRMGEAMWKRLLSKKLPVDTVLYLPGEECKDDLSDMLPREMLRKLKQFYVWKRNCPILEDFLWQEYGMPLIKIKDVDSLPKQGRRLLIEDGAELPQSAEIKDWERINLWKDEYQAVLTLARKIGIIP